MLNENSLDNRETDDESDTEGVCGVEIDEAAEKRLTNADEDDVF